MRKQRHKLVLVDTNHSHPVRLDSTSTPTDHQLLVVFPRVAQSIRGLEQDSGLDNRARSGAPQYQEFLQEAAFTEPNSGWIVNSGWASSTDRTDAPRTTASTLVLQAERLGATISIPGISPPRCPSPRSSTEIQRKLSYINGSTTPRETDVAATTAAATGAVNSSASLTSASASGTGAKLTVAAPAVSVSCATVGGALFESKYFSMTEEPNHCS